VRPGCLEPLRGLGDFPLPRLRRSAQRLRVLQVVTGVEPRLEKPPPEADPVARRGSGRTDGDRAVTRGEDLQIRVCEVDRQERHDVVTRPDQRAVDRRAHEHDQLVAQVMRWREPGARPLGEKFRPPARENGILAPLRGLRVRPAEPVDQEVAERPPVRGRLTAAHGRVRVVAVGPVAENDRPRRGQVHLEPPRVRVGRDVGCRPCRGRDAGPQRLVEELKREVDCATRPALSGVERRHVDLVVGKGQQADAVPAPESQARDLAAEDIGPPVEDLGHR
jgi:hypothetical protein